jgi:hypothetical protein
MLKRKLHEYVMLSVPSYVPNVLAEHTPHPLDCTITFEEQEHKYGVKYNGDTTFTYNHVLSVSGFIHDFFHTFDTDKIISNMMKRRNWSSSPYFGMTSESIKQLWHTNGQDASAAGTAFHAVVECICNGWIVPETYQPNKALEQWINWKKNVFDKAGMLPFRTELRMRADIDTYLVGTADLIAIHKDHAGPESTGGVLTLHIRDWKNSREIKRIPFNKAMGKSVLSHLVDTNYEHYALQQNLYKWLLETYYTHWTWNNKEYTSCKVETIQLIVCHENHGDETLVVDVPCRMPEIHKMVDERRKYISSLGAETMLAH